MTIPYNKGKSVAVAWLRSHAAYRGDNCLIWPFSCVRGYGQLKMDGKRGYAHRFMCELVHGPAPSLKHHAAHSCGRGDRACVNPRHISWKTPSENMQDKMAHGTARQKGTPRYKLTPEHVAEIRALAGMTIAAMAAQFGVSESCIRKIRNGTNWPTGQYTFGSRGRALSPVGD